MKNTSWLLTCCSALLLLAGSCEKLQGYEYKPEVIHIEGFLLTDSYGNITGEIGETTDDWRLGSWDRLNALEKNFLSFPDNISLSQTAVTEIAEPLAFPNPFTDKSYIYFRTTDSVKLKIAIVDGGGFVWRNMALKMKGNKMIYFDFSGSGELPSGISLRYYYSFSAAGQLNFKSGYGDIKLCRDTENFMSCFQVK